MLIRAQDKKSLVNYSMSLGVSIGSQIDNAFPIYIHNVTDKQTIKIATYSTERKALKVIDSLELMIRTYKSGKSIYSGISTKQFITAEDMELASNKVIELFNSSIFVMPEDSEVNE